MQKEDSERRSLNKKLLKSTFQSEIKHNWMTGFHDIIPDIISIFIGSYLSNILIKYLGVDLIFLKIVFNTIIIILMLSLSSYILKAIRKQNNNPNHDNK